MVDQADFFSALRGQQLARQQEFLGTAEADALCPDRRAAIASQQADDEVRAAELRVVGGNEHVDDKDKRRPAAAPVAVETEIPRLLATCCDGETEASETNHMSE